MVHVRLEEHATAPIRKDVASNDLLNILIVGFYNYKKKTVGSRPDISEAKDNKSIMSFLMSLKFMSYRM